VYNVACGCSVVAELECSRCSACANPTQLYTSQLYTFIHQQSHMVLPSTWVDSDYEVVSCYFKVCNTMHRLLTCLCNVNCLSLQIYRSHRSCTSGATWCGRRRGWRDCRALASYSQRRTMAATTPRLLRRSEFNHKMCVVIIRRVFTYSTVVYLLHWLVFQDYRVGAVQSTGGILSQRDHGRPRPAF
jgi:hypothetical protein